ncbi:hypothetical protein PMAYCL1PPCAC_13008, partial [Pristionchus mayeri]
LSTSNFGLGWNRLEFPYQKADRCECAHLKETLGMEDDNVVINLKQTLEWADYTGFLAVGAIFSVVVFCISFFCLNWFCVQKEDDITVFEKWGALRKMKMGPHRLSVVERKAAEERIMIARLE